MAISRLAGAAVRGASGRAAQGIGCLVRVGPSAGAASTRTSQGKQHLSTSARVHGPWDTPVDPAKKMNRYIIIAEDYANPGALARRLEVRDAHLEEAKSGVEAGRIEMGGGLLGRDFKDVDPDSSLVYSLSGSAFVVQGESVEDVESRLKADKYAQAGVWDMSKVRILPFLPAFVNAPKIQATPQEQHDAVQRRIPRGNSRARLGSARRAEVYVSDPRGSGKAINTADRTTLESSLGALRRRSAATPQGKGGTGQGASDASLQTLRRYSRPPVYENEGGSSSSKNDGTAAN